jgi:hypothetical protein
MRTRMLAAAGMKTRHLGAQCAVRHGGDGGRRVVLLLAPGDRAGSSLIRTATYRWMGPAKLGPAYICGVASTDRDGRTRYGPPQEAVPASVSGS